MVNFPVACLSVYCHIISQYRRILSFLIFSRHFSRKIQNSSQITFPSLAMSSRRQSLRLQNKNPTEGASSARASRSRALRSNVNSRTRSLSPQPKESHRRSSVPPRNTFQHTEEAILPISHNRFSPSTAALDSKIAEENSNPSSTSSQISNTEMIPNTNESFSNAEKTSPSLHDSKTSDIPVNAPHFSNDADIPNTDTVPDTILHTDHESSTHTLPADLEEQMELDIAEEVEKRSLTSPSREPVIPNTTQDDSSSRLLSIENKLDFLLTVQKLSFKSHDDTCKHLKSIETRLESVTDGIQSLFSCIRESPKYDDHFAKVVDLFGHTFATLDTIDDKLSSINTDIKTHTIHSGGVSVASDSSDDLKSMRIPNANLASISVPKPPSFPPNPVTKGRPVSSPSHLDPSDPSNINSSILEILDKLVESKTTKAPTNLAFPSFSGSSNSITFHRWSTLVCGILSTSEWKKLYDDEKQSYIADGNEHPILNNHLYSALLLKLKGPAADYATARKELRGDGIGLIEALRTTFKSVLTPADLFDLEEKFRHHSRGKEQAIESYVTELETMRQEILDNGGYCPPKHLKHNFILNLGPEFSDITHSTVRVATT